jgi:hypothetical protein
MTQPIPEDMTELVNADIDRVDLVGKAANGTRFILAKSGESPALFTPADVRDILKADTEAADTVTGDDAPLPTADELMTSTSANADGMGVPTKAPGDPDDPNSAAWEAVDAARGRQMLQLAIALQRLVSTATDREAQEAVLGDGDDAGNVWTLEDVSSTIDCMLSMLAPFALTEQAEADQRSAGALMKAGRTLSANNEASIRQASDLLQKVLSSLPMAPDEAPITKETELATEETPAAPVAKADGDASGLVAVFNQKGVLVGVTDPTNIQAVSGAGADDTPAEPDPAPAPADPAAQDPSDMTKSEELDPVAKAVQEAMAPLLKRIDELEHTPVPTGALLAGHNPGTAPASRPMGEGLSREDLFKRVQEESDPGNKMLGIAEMIKRERFGE